LIFVPLTLTIRETRGPETTRSMGDHANMSEPRGHAAEPPLVHCILHEGVITFVSANSVQTSGHPPERFQGHGWLEFVHPDDQASLMQFAAPDWEGIIDATFRMQDADGAWTWRRAEGVRTIEADGKPSTIVTLRKIDAPD
jgi:PAS domain S-box-containing protein